MKSCIISSALLVLIVLVVPVYAIKDDVKSAESALKNIDAVEAMAIANKWKWTKKEIKTYVTPAEVVFEFPGGKVKKVSLPKDKMVIAVAPYIRRTHK
ncbi:MAG: hypothetical protein JRH18_22075 [Deltaproteobacteria bacterium]|nr:hypothetical protein [Deltaproteobacteria bacterium]MBW1961899.1 hypothetical protein [Deltaproteobacteria bacterium]MBW2154339.1 hypothetical protein [Deltaproteobacteria bacterium]